MKKIAFVAFLILFIAAACLPAFSRPHRGWDRESNTFFVVTPSRTHWLGGKSIHAWHGLSRNCIPCSEDLPGEPAPDSGSGKAEDTVVK